MLETYIQRKEKLQRTGGSFANIDMIFIEYQVQEWFNSDRIYCTMLAVDYDSTSARRIGHGGREPYGSSHGYRWARCLARKTACFCLASCR